MTKVITIIKKYFFLITIIFVYILTEFSLISLTAWKQTTSSFLWNIPIFLTYILGYGVIGACFGVDYLLTERKKSGIWQVKKYSFFLLAIPAFLIANIPWGLWSPYLGTDRHCVIFNMLFGYLAMKSIYKS
ncbi:hypothetical protein GMB34_00575 [Turicibacter sanguinis]|nr:hypothetical protein [Turicibacter sanguinis]MTN82675.1 hypothetical protein [Turicibacter sanguinis]MTN85647.1 hypothetical protein [Turicibacter sanguinis]MTN88405.1 hypothetical protein [Turicibacter sanguinis]MTN92189.1 hypothetical protein [Turicibacter sanguinis]